MPISINGTSGISGVDGSAGTPALQGTDTNTGISFGTDVILASTGGTERLRIDSSGRVGLGNNAPGNYNGVFSTVIGNTSSTNNGLVVSTSSTGSAWIGFNNTGGAEIPGYIKYDNSNSSLQFQVNSSERFRCDSSGRLLVGTSSASAAATSVLVQGNGSSSTAEGIIRLTRGTTTPGASDELGTIAFGDSNHNTAAYLACNRDGGTWNTSTSRPTRLVFSTTADGASSPTERMRITNNGQISTQGGTGFTVESTTSTYLLNEGTLILNTKNGNGALYCNQTFDDSATRGAVFFYRNETKVGEITVSTTNTSYVTSSDHRLKENVVAVTDGITRLQQLKPSRFNFIADPNKTVDGFIAHEVQDVVPEAITGEKDAVDEDGNPIYQGIDQSKLVPLLTAALQETIAKIESLETRLAALEVTP